jgi:hypothetical protein
MSTAGTEGERWRRGAERSRERAPEERRERKVVWRCAEKR